jgi:hypothetical protein
VPASVVQTACDSNSSQNWARTECSSKRPSSTQHGEMHTAGLQMGRPLLFGLCAVQQQCSYSARDCSPRHTICCNERKVGSVQASLCFPNPRPLAAALLQLAANFTCSDQRSLTVATTNVQTVARPRLTLRLGRQPPPGCGGKPAVAIIRYNLRGLQDGQDFDLAAQVGPNCTAQLNSSECSYQGLITWMCWLVPAALLKHEELCIPNNCQRAAVGS